MHSKVLYAALFAGLAVAAPAGKREEEFSPDNVYYPLDNGFPDPSADAILQIQKDAHGTLPNNGPDGVSPDGATNLKLVALNELFEVAFFTELLFNVTNKLPGYDLDYAHEYAKDSLKSIVNQEQLHALNANRALKKFDHEPIKPCKYSFPVTDFHSAVDLARLFTDLVLGTLQDVAEVYAKNGDFKLVRGVAATIGNEAEQQGFFRLVQSLRPNAQPFLTTSVRDFAFTAIQSFVVPDSCPNINTIPLRTFKPLTVLTPKPIEAKTQSIKFEFAEEDVKDVVGHTTEDYSKLSLVWINAQNKPIVEALQFPEVKDGKVTFEAGLPWEEYVMNGLTIAAVTKGSGPFKSAAEVSDAAILGPGLIQIE